MTKHSKLGRSKASTAREGNARRPHTGRSTESDRDAHAVYTSARALTDTPREALETSNGKGQSFGGPLRTANTSRDSYVGKKLELI